MKYHLHHLPNRLNIMHMQTKSPIAHCGLLINAGTRDESEPAGLAHFIEHVIFKGTKKRRAHHVLARLENLGGEINAFTTKEETCIYASFLPAYTQQVFELMADICFCSVFPDNEIRKEKEVVMDEMNSYTDNPFEEISDEIEELVFQDHPLGKKVLGTAEGIKKIKREDILNFTGQYFKPSNMLLFSTSNIDPGRIFAYAGRHFGIFDGSGFEHQRNAFGGISAPGLTRIKPISQAHCILGRTAPSMGHEDRTAGLLVNNILGGPGMNSRLNMSLREKSGISYHAESAYNPYSDSGSMLIYFSSEKELVGKSIDLVRKEARKLRGTRPGTLQLHRAKEQLKGQIMIAAESPLNDLMSAARTFLHTRIPESAEDACRKTDALTSDDITGWAERYLNIDDFTIITYLPEK